MSEVTVDTFLENEIEHYYVYLKQDEIFEDRRNPYSEEERNRKKRQCRTLSFWCFNPGLGFRKILKLEPRAIVLTSGTLSPMRSFE
jgi:regulator of telomere elongation helicase 1